MTDFFLHVCMRTSRLVCTGVLRKPTPTDCCVETHRKNMLHMFRLHSTALTTQQWSLQYSVETANQD